MPDSFFDNQETHDRVTTLSNISDEKLILTMFENNTTPSLVYSFSTKVSIKCKMNFAHFPFDTQICEFRLGSLRQEPNLNWEKEGSNGWIGKPPIHRRNSRGRRILYNGEFLFEKLMILIIVWFALVNDTEQLL